MRVRNFLIAAILAVCLSITAFAQVKVPTLISDGSFFYNTRCTGSCTIDIDVSSTGATTHTFTYMTAKDNVKASGVNMVVSQGADTTAYSAITSTSVAAGDTITTTGTYHIFRVELTISPSTAVIDVTYHGYTAATSGLIRPGITYNATLPGPIADAGTATDLQIDPRARLIISTCDLTYYAGASTADVEAVAATANQTIRICSYAITNENTTASAVNLRYATANDCTTGATDITPAVSFGTSTSGGMIPGIVIGSALWGGLKSPVGRNLCIHRTASQSSEVFISYTITTQN
jgi:hypothetical protein